MNSHDPDFDLGHEGEPPGADVLAGEYVLGVLDAEQRRQAQARIATEQAFARLVAGWERRLAAMLDEIEPVAVPEHLWPRIRTRLGWSPVAGDVRPGPWQRVGVWRAATALATAAALVAIYIGRLPPTSLPPPSVVVAPAVEPARAVTTLAYDDGTPAWLASIDAVRGTLLLVPVPAPADAQGRVPELWLIPAGETPRSLGLLPTDKTRQVAVPRELLRALVRGSTLAVSLEPAGGAPQGVPTGPIIAKAGIERI